MINPLFAIFLAFAPGTLLPQQTAPAVRSAAVPTTVHQLYLDDQEDRSQDGKPLAYGADMTARDTVRRAELRVLITAGKLQTAEDFHDAAYIFQHSLDADDYLLAHILAVEAVVKGNVKSKWIAAATLDRYLQAIGRKQVFGTQYTTTRRTGEVKPTTTQEPYNRDLMPDALRLDFCVPNLEQQKANVKEFEAGRYPSGILPPGCTR